MQIKEKMQRVSLANAENQNVWNNTVNVIKRANHAAKIVSVVTAPMISIINTSLNYKKKVVQDVLARKVVVKRTIVSATLQVLL